MKKIDRSFYMDNDVLSVARKLIGKTLFSKVDGMVTSARISETEAYAGEKDKASHAYGGRRTSRTRVMYLRGGCAYIYLCYGIHSMFNVVTSMEGIPHAVLIRGLLPVQGLSIMESRLGKKISGVISGPGLSAKAMGIHYSMTGESLLANRIWIMDDEQTVNSTEISVTPRIGIDYAGEDASLPYRFLWNT